VFAIRWTLITMMWIMQSAIVIPTRLGFSSKANAFTACLDYLSEIWFLVDIWMNFHIGFVDHDTGEDVLNREMIRIAYVKSWLLMDMASATPVSFMVLVMPTFSQYKFLKVLRILKIFRLIKMLKVKAWETLEDNGKVHSSHVRFIKLLFTFLFLLHFLASAFWSIVENSCVPCPDDSIGLDGHKVVCLPGEPMYKQFCPQDWRVEGMINPVGAKPLDDDWVDSTLTSKYLYAFNWALLAMLGDNPFPQSNRQFIFTIFALSFGLLTFSCIIGSLASMLTSMDALANNKKDQLDAIQSYLRYRRVDPELRMRIHGYYKYLWDSGQSKVHMDMFTELPPVLAMELNVALKEELIVGAALFKFCKPATTLMLLNELHSSIVIPNQIIYQQGDSAMKMYFVNRGLVDTFINVEQSAMAGDLGANPELRKVAQDRSKHFATLVENDGNVLQQSHMGRLSMKKVDSLGKGSTFGEVALVERLLWEQRIITGSLSDEQIKKDTMRGQRASIRKRSGYGAHGRRKATVIAAVYTELEDLDKATFCNLLAISQEMREGVIGLVQKRTKRHRLVLSVLSKQNREDRERPRSAKRRSSVVRALECLLTFCLFH
jgi:potassium voltage-gated channel Eag-related subfamily H protein 7